MSDLIHDVMTFQESVPRSAKRVQSYLPHLEKLCKPSMEVNALSQCCQDDSVAALAVDWVTSNLYWSSIKKPDLHVTSRAEGHTAVLLHASAMVVEDLLVLSFNELPLGLSKLSVPAKMILVHTPSGHYLHCFAPPLRMAVLHSSDGGWEEPGRGGLLLDGWT